MAPSYCVMERKPCVRWVEIYFKDCLCNLKDEISFGFGLTSLVFWGVAEIPSNNHHFSHQVNHGVSLAFLLTWVAGDICNLVGCLLEPATLPTQALHSS
ncbi:PQ-loop repeat, partial [Sesbania bispinosa]